MYQQLCENAFPYSQSLLHSYLIKQGINVDTKQQGINVDIATDSDRTVTIKPVCLLFGFKVDTQLQGTNVDIAIEKD